MLRARSTTAKRAGDVSRPVHRESDERLDALLAPHRAWLEGRAALETLGRDEANAARDAFARALELAPDAAPVHVGMAHACAFRFESTRADLTPDAPALAAAVHHARAQRDQPRRRPRPCGRAKGHR